MARRIRIDAMPTLADHERHAHLGHAVAALREFSAPAVAALHGRTLWLVNSTEQGGGVAEMLPGLITHLRHLGVRAEWVVIDAPDPAFFELTKRIHNLIHGVSSAPLSAADRELYESVNRDNADGLRELVADGDILVVHDPQPMPIAAMVKETRRVNVVWRCHIGLDDVNDATTQAWSFLKPHADAYEHAVFSAPEYIPDFLRERSTVIFPGLDPLSPKNHPLQVQEIIDTLLRAGLMREPRLLVGGAYAAQVRRLQPDRSFVSASEPDDLELLTRPLVTQVSRWDRLKGFEPLMRAFAHFKRELAEDPPADPGVRRYLELTRLILAGPEPDGVDDDPEAGQVLSSLRDAYAELPPEIARDIAVLSLPMASATENARIVNALQRVSTLVVQNSLREGFGLTIAEAMWKGVPVLASARACGPRHQIRDGIDGMLVPDPEDVVTLSRALRALLGTPEGLREMGVSARQRSYDLLVYGQLEKWLQLLATIAEKTA